MAQTGLAELVVGVAVQAFRFLCHVDGMKVAWALGSGTRFFPISSTVNLNSSSSSAVGTKRRPKPAASGLGVGAGLKNTGGGASIE
jgi:hypothetical protein